MSDAHDVVSDFFFFQAEDGIRDLVRSRGLGDVYKRQASETQARAQFVTEGVAADKVKLSRFGKFRYQNQAVSYTHLTLPTSDLV